VFVYSAFIYRPGDWGCLWVEILLISLGKIKEIKERRFELGHGRFLQFIVQRYSFSRRCNVLKTESAA